MWGATSGAPGPSSCKCSLNISEEGPLGGRQQPPAWLRFPAVCGPVFICSLLMRSFMCHTHLPSADLSQALP